MADHKQVRPYYEGLRRAGAQNPGEILIRDPVQMVQVVDRTDHLIRPLMTPQVIAQQFITAAAGLRAALQVHVLSGGGMWVHELWGILTGTITFFQSATSMAGLGAEAIPTAATSSIFGEGTPQNPIAVGDTATLFPSPLNVTSRVNAELRHPLEMPLWIAPGLFFVVMNTTLAQNGDLGVTYREIPARSDVPVA